MSETELDWHSNIDVLCFLKLHGWPAKLSWTLSCTYVLMTLNGCFFLHVNGYVDAFVACWLV